jgi:peptidoglycan/xylan/chitin deacetylase (PgdA/CDA1 family)
MTMNGLKGGLIRALDALRVAEASSRLRAQDVVLVYHSVEDRPSGFPHSVSTESYAAHMRHLVAHYDVVPLDELFSRPGPQQRSRVAITFDDAYAEMYDNVLPLAQKYNAPFTVFVPTRFVQERTRLLANYGPGSDKEHLTWQQMRAMQATGLVQFESHSHSHLNAVAETNRLESDILTSIRLIESELAYRPRYFAYPFGNCNQRTHEIALGCGFQRVFTIESVPVRGQLVEGRIDIGRMNERLDYYKLSVAGINTFTLRRMLTRRPAPAALPQA